jgi:quercetin dioxygenase-like cupin family protein
VFAIDSFGTTVGACDVATDDRPQQRRNLTHHRRMRMNKLSLQAKARELARKAAGTNSGRAAGTVFGGHEKHMRQTVIALRAGAEMAEHQNPGEATVLVISGRLRLVAGDTSWQGREWDYLIVPNTSHSVEAETDTTFLLTVTMSAR